MYIISYFTIVYTFIFLLAVEVQGTEETVNVVFKPLTGSVNKVDESVYLRSNSTTTSLVQHPCKPATSMIISNYLYLTQDEFRTELFPLSIPFSILQSDHVYVTCVAFVNETLLLVVNGELLVLDLHTMNITIATGILNNVNWVVTSPCCYTEDAPWCREHNSIVFVYNSQMTTGYTSVWWSYDGGHQFQAVNFTVNDQGSSVISGVFLHPFKHEATLLVQVDHARTLMKNYNYITRQFQDWTGTIPFSTKGLYIPAIQLNYRSESFIFVNGSTIFYSPVSDVAMRPVKLNGQQNDTHHLNPGEEILIVTPGYQEYFILVTTKQRVLLGREEGMTAEVTEILQGIYNSDTGLAFDRKDNIQLYTAWNRVTVDSTQAVEFHKSMYNIHGLVQSYTSAPCKYQAILNNYKEQIFYLDIAMEIDLSITMYSEPWKQSEFIVFVSNPELLEFSSEVTHKRHTTIRGVTENSMNTHISLRVDTVSDSTVDGIEGMSIVRIGSLDGSLRCLQDQHKESLVIGGCPPGRHIRVRKPETGCEGWRDTVYTIEKNLYDPTYLLGRSTTGTQDETLTYDLDKLGCPFLVHFADPFKPIIDLYDGDVFVEEVMVNYVVYDINGRYTFSYTMSNKEALCSSQAQDWLTMLEAQEEPNPYTAWTNKNFVSCYNNSGSRVADRKHAYEIMNSSSSNKIKWQAYSGMYIFNVTVVDPNYSFCSLTAQFAVEVYGALPEAPFPQMHIMLGICAFGVLSVWFMYGTYNVITKSDEQNDKE